MTVPPSVRDFLQKSAALVTQKLPQFSAPQLLSIAYNYKRLGLLELPFRSEIAGRLDSIAAELDSSRPCPDFQHLVLPGVPTEPLNNATMLSGFPDGRCFVYKPPGHVVDVLGDFEPYSSSSSTPVASMKHWAIQNFREFPIIADQSHSHGFLHRLDTQTSGALLLALNYRAYYAARLRFALNEVEKIYTCLVEGEAPQFSVYTDRLLTLPVATEVGRASSYVQVTTEAKGKSARTESTLVAKYESIETGKIYSLLSVKISTGRTHQIRVHLAHAGLPIVGDAKYGKKRTQVSDRMFLHAGTLDGVHCPLAGDLVRALARLRPRPLTH